MIVEKNLKYKTFKLHHYNFEKNIYIDLKIKESGSIIERKNKIAPYTDLLINCFVLNEFFGTTIDINSINATISKNLKISSIEKILMINYNVIKDAIKEMRNKDNYGICEYFDNVNHSRYSKLKNKIDYLNKMAEKIDELAKDQDIEKEKHEEISFSSESDD